MESFESRPWIDELVCCSHPPSLDLHNLVITQTSPWSVSFSFMQADMFSVWACSLWICLPCRVRYDAFCTVTDDGTGSSRRTAAVLIVLSPHFFTFPVWLSELRGSVKVEAVVGKGGVMQHWPGLCTLHGCPHVAQRCRLSSSDASHQNVLFVFSDPELEPGQHFIELLLLWY